MTSGITAAESRPIVLAIVTADRPEALSALATSLAPVDGDRGVHVVVFDHGQSDAGRRCVTDVLARWALRSAGARLHVQAQDAGLPLHAARLALAASIADTPIAAQRPIVWMLDDDLRFESVDVELCRVRVRNVARPRIREVREAATTTLADLLVGHFTQDPPIRPDAVQATQLGDLAAELARFRALRPADLYTPMSPPERTRDDYYDHAEGTRTHLEVRHPWLPRGTEARSNRDELRELCAEASRIFSGGTPLRPLFERHLPVARETPRPARGGNTVFLDWEHFRAHEYPSIRIGGSWSRRSDMIGTSLLVRHRGARVREGGLSLRHDRTNQPRARFDSAGLGPELVGVLLERLISGRVDVSAPDGLLAYGLERATRIFHAQECALRHAADAIMHLEDPRVWWYRDPRAAALSSGLREHVEALGQTRPTAPEELVPPASTLRDLRDCARAMLARKPRSRSERGETCAGG